MAQSQSETALAASEGARAAVEAILQTVYIHITDDSDPLETLEHDIELLIRDRLAHLATAAPVDPDDEDGIAERNRDRGSLRLDLSPAELEAKQKLLC